MNIILSNKLNTSLVGVPKISKYYPIGKGIRMIRCDFVQGEIILLTDELSLFSRIIRVPQLVYSHFIVSVHEKFEDNSAISLNVYSYQNRRVTGSMNDMKRIIEIFISDGKGIEEAELLINKTPFKLLGMKCPNDVFSPY